MEIKSSMLTHPLAAPLFVLVYVAVEETIIHTPQTDSVCCTMYATLVRRAPIFCRVVDTLRLDDPVAGPGTCYPIRVELGDGVTTLSVQAVQDILDKTFARSQRFGTTKSGFVYDKRRSVVTEVTAYGQYIVTGSLRGGYMKPDRRYGPRLTGYNGATTKPGLKWNGEDL